jgi:hypothetical protein
VSRLVRGAGGLMPEHYEQPVWCQTCLSVIVSHVSEPCAECSIDAEEDRAIPGYWADTMEESKGEV